MASPTLPSSLKRIDSEAFSCCFEINSITLPDGIEILDTFVFWATPLKELVLPKSLIFIGDDICVWDSPNNTPLYLVYADTYGQTWAEDSKVLYRILE